MGFVVRSIMSGVIAKAVSSNLKMPDISNIGGGNIKMPDIPIADKIPGVSDIKSKISGIDASAITSQIDLSGLQSKLNPSTLMSQINIPEIPQNLDPSNFNPEDLMEGFKLN